MKTNLFLFIASVAICLSPLLAGAQGNLIVNGSFEDNGGQLYQLECFTDGCWTCAGC
jgi:hypothetical protein